MLNKDIYKDLCENHNISLFSQNWWLDAVVNSEGWDVIIVKNGDDIVGALPYSIQKIGYIFTGIYNPKLTQRTELFINYPEKQSYQEKISFEIKVISKLISKIPKTSFMSINFNYSFLNWLPFYWNNYNSTVRYSYVLSDIKNPDEVFSRFHPHTIKKIKQTEDKYQIIDSADIETFYKLNKQSFERKKIKIPYDYKTLYSIDKACSLRNNRKILMAYNDNNAIGGIYLVWDNEYVYYLTSGLSSLHKSSGAASLLVWESIKFASLMNKKFDFEGSMHKSIEPFFRSFNPRPQFYLNIHKYNNILLKLYKTMVSKCD